MPIGRESIAHNASLSRECVFSHDELICKMVKQTGLNPDCSPHCMVDLQQIRQNQLEIRSKCNQLGITLSVRTVFELLPDHERLCFHCKTLCFLWAFTCRCSDQLTCPDHVDKLCRCPPSGYTLRFRYDLHEIDSMIKSLDDHDCRYKKWNNKLAGFFPAKIDVGEPLFAANDLANLYKEGSTYGFFRASEQLCRETVMRSYLKTAGDAASILCSLFNKNERYVKILLSDLYEMKRKTYELPLKIEKYDQFMDLLQRIEFLKQENTVLWREKTIDIVRVERLLEMDIPFDKIDLSEEESLRDLSRQYDWMNKSFDLFEKEISIEQVIDFISSERSAVRHPSVANRLLAVNRAVWAARRFEEDARAALQARNLTVAQLEQVVGEEVQQSLSLPNVAMARKAIKDSQLWIAAFNDVMNGNMSFPFDILEQMTEIGSTLPLNLKEMEILESCVKENRKWKNNAEKFFLKKNSTESLLSVLWPSTVHEESLAEFNKVFNVDKKLEWEDLKDIRALSRDTKTVIAAYKNAKKVELESMKTSRMLNLEKRNHHRLKASEFCFCHKPPNNSMLCCSTCNDLYHESCVISSLRLGYATIRTSMLLTKNNKFVCMKCSRTRRPRLENVINLLVGLQRSTFRVPEGELLQCVAEVMINWQIRVNRLLRKEQVVDLLRRPGIDQTSPPSYPNYKQLSLFNADVSNEGNFTAMLNEPNYAGTDEPRVDIKQGGRRTRKAQLVPRQFDCPVMELTDYDLSCIEELMVEGDLYQISSHEAEKLWDVLEVSRGNPMPLFPDILPETGKKDGPRKGRPRGKKRPGTVGEIPAKKPRKLGVKNKLGREIDGVDGLFSVNSSSDSFVDYDEEDTNCDSLDCKYPVGPVDWTTCTNCQSRFHTICVTDSIDFMSDFYCLTCLDEFDSLKPTPGLFEEFLNADFPVFPPTVKTHSGVQLVSMEDDFDIRSDEKAVKCELSSPIHFITPTSSEEN